MNPFASQELSSLQGRIRKARKTRALFAGAVLCEGFPLAGNLAAGLRFPALLIAFAAVMFTVNAALQTRVIRRLRREEARLLHEVRPRPDYAAIARMELEVWGEAFEHAGAPSVTGERLCSWCSVSCCFAPGCAGRNRRMPEKPPGGEAS